ncbi:uncharacterized protein myripa [Nerophis lumbriciformis]|uniref:uncharacterized protein myripa n=1 Tax=Nerophis lumbriciformis TaxID=546530 RepID=UPI002ADFC3A5|nr:trichohyalin-like [Nerophis lumbriciformis]
MKSDVSKQPSLSSIPPSELKQALDEEGSRCLLLSRQRCFNQRCCIRCCAPFSFLLNPKRRCHDCLYSVCKACRLYHKHDKAWLCSACQKSRLLKKQSLEWFYAHVKVRFKRFGSAKVLKTIYRRHLAEHSVLSELTEGSAYEDSICNEGSVCGSDATFYRQTEEHSMAESLTVALRVAEEAIDEAICNAEIDTATQGNRTEAQYLREHKAELIEELAKTIMQKIISGRKTLADTRDKCDQDVPDLERDPDLHHHGDQAGSTFKHLKGLWRSQSAFSLVDDNLPAGLVQDALQALHKEEDSAAGTTWTSVERLENSGVSSMLKSPDGNWIALQSSQLSRPSLLAKRKSPVYSALERESGAVSAYEGMDSDNEAKPEPDTSWGAILQEFHRKMTGSKVRRPAHNRARSDSERSKKSPLDTFNKRGAAEPKRPPSSRRTSIMDVNFNVTTEEGITRSEAAVGKVKRARKKRRSKRRATLSGPPLDFNRKDGQSGSPSDAETPDPLTPDATTPSLLRQESDTPEHQSDQVDPESSQESMSDSSLRDEANDDDDAEEVEMGSEDERTAVDFAVDREEEEEVKARLYKLVAQSRLAYFSSTDDELDRAGRSEEDGGCDEEDKTERLSHKLCQLEEEVRAAMLSSTEDELDRVTDGEKNEEEEEEELAVKVCRLATQVGATQFSSTEDELDREEVMHEETLWRLQEDKAAPAAQVRHLASLVSASQFSSTEDELDRVGEDEAQIDQGGSGQPSLSEELSEDATGELRERLESMGDVEVDMFALSQQNEEMRENLLDSTDQYGEVNLEESNGRMSKDILLVSDKNERTSKETIIRQEFQPEVKMSDQREERQEEKQDILGGREGDLLGTQLETTASVSEDDAEIDQGGGGQPSLSEELSEDATGERRERLESMGDVEMDMFALSQQNEEMRENLLDSTDQYGEVNLEESNGRMSKDILLVLDKDERTSKETIITQEYQPEVKMSDQREERQEEEQDILGGREGDLLGTQLETTASVSEDEAEIDQGGGGQPSLSEELSEDATGERRERLESMGDVEMDMFALSQQNEEMRENLLDSTDQYGEVNLEESNGRMSKDILLVSDKNERTSKETIIRQEFQPEVKMSDQREERQEEEQDILRGREGDLLGTQLETTASVSEDDAEIDQGGGGQPSLSEELSEDATGERRERLESMGDVEMDMFALSQQNEEMRENLLDSTDQYGEVNLEESNGRMSKDILLVSDKNERTSKETIIRQEYQPEVKMSDQREERQEEEQDILGGREGDLLGTQLETTASVSEDEDVEFDRVISSMLTMTLEEMQKDIRLDQRREGTETDEETNEELEMKKDTETDNESKYDTKTEEERKEDANTDVKTKEDFKTDGEWKEDTRPDKSGNEFPVTEQDNNKVAKTEEMKDEQKEDSKTNTNNKEEPKTDNEKNQGENIDAEKEEDSKTDKNKDQDAKMDKERKGNSKTDKDWNEDQKADKEKKEDTKTSEVRNEDGKTEMDTQTDQETKGLEDRQDKEKIDDTRTDDGKKEDKETIMDKNKDEKYKERKKDKKEIQKSSAASLCSISTEVLKVLNATEELLQGVEGRGSRRPSTWSLPANADPKKLDQRFSQLEEKVYVAAGSVFGVEAELSDLEERARDISSATSDTELSSLEEQVASAAARVQQSEQQISDISARIAALRSAGLNVDPQSRVAKTATVPVMPLTLNSSRQRRRRLPALPRGEDKKSSP